MCTVYTILCVIKINMCVYVFDKYMHTCVTAHSPLQSVTYQYTYLLRLHAEGPQPVSYKPALAWKQSTFVPLQNAQCSGPAREVKECPQLDEFHLQTPCPSGCTATCCTTMKREPRRRLLSQPHFDVSTTSQGAVLHRQQEQLLLQKHENIYRQGCLQQVPHHTSFFPSMDCHPRTAPQGNRQGNRIDPITPYLILLINNNAFLISTSRFSC